MLDTAHEADMSDNGRSAQYRAREAPHRAPVAALVDRAGDLLDSATSHQAGARNRLRQSLWCTMDVPLRRSIDDWRGCSGSKDRIRCSFCKFSYLDRSKFGGTHRCERECMAEFQAQVPHPLRENEPEFLAPGGLGTPAVWILFFVLIGEHGFKRSTMYVQGDDISGRERAWRQGSVEQLVDHFATRGTNGRLSWSRQIAWQR